MKIEVLRNAIDLDPNYWFDYNFLGRAYEAKGRLAEAIETFKHGLTLEGNTELYAGLGHAYALSGDKVAAYKVLDQMNSLSKQRYVAPYNVAVISAGLGEKDKAFDWLNRAYDDRSYLLPVYLNTDTRLDRALYPCRPWLRIHLGCATPAFRSSVSRASTKDGAA